RVHPDEVVREDWCAIACRIAGQTARIDGVRTSIASGCPAVEKALIDVDALLVFRGGPGWGLPGRAAASRQTVARRQRGRLQRSVESDIVEGSHGARRATGHDRHQTGERIRRLRGRGVEIAHAVCDESGEVGTEGRPAIYPAQALGAVDEVERMHPVDADQEHVADAVSFL